ncbi:MAG: hypothetical protein GX766_05335 [Firmicutes bacterium]|jgi:hypothetical protein|nr:hypothetical protein [Bacillota bacterium]HOB22190.1 hypothetical protein [Bacillota bacterium]HQD40559.1 hypothetical protein [Bacillota bacterium]
MFNFASSEKRMDIVVLILFLIFFVDPLLPNKLINAFRQLFQVQNQAQEKRD